MEAFEREVTLKNKYGLHARPATLLAETANGFQCEVVIEKAGQSSNGKSIFELMMLAAEKGTLLTLRATGPDAQEAVTALEALIDGKFNEE
ncbi:MAG: HPr family phosphocarrier protein [Planctomycetota bacterium]|jgi:phosphocarrier protein